MIHNEIQTARIKKKLKKLCKRPILDTITRKPPNWTETIRKKTMNSNPKHQKIKVSLLTQMKEKHQGNSQRLSDIKVSVFHRFTRKFSSLLINTTKQNHNLTKPTPPMLLIPKMHQLVTATKLKFCFFIL